MSRALRTSTLRLVAGGVLALLGVGVFTFVLPRASRKLDRERRAADHARTALTRAREELEAAQAEDRRLKANREVLDTLMRDLPSETVGHLTWRLSQALFDLTARHSVRLQAVRYGAPAKEGTRGMALEAVDVDFTASGLYQDLKAFMLALEGGRLPFAVVSAKLDEGPEGAQLAIVLRAFRQLPAGDGGAGGEHS